MFSDRFASLVTVPVHEGAGSFRVEILDCCDCGATHFSDSVVEYRSHEHQNYLDNMEAADLPICGQCMTRGENEDAALRAGPYIDKRTGELRYECLRYYD